MSWLFSRALVGAFSEANCSDGAPSAPSSGNPTPQAYLPSDRMTAFSRPSRFGMTFSPLTADRGGALLTSYLAAFPVKTSASQAEEPALTAPAAGCGDTWRGSLARFDHDTSSWKTAQRSLLGDSDECSVIWPRSGMTADGQCWELPTLERRIKETDSGLWPTPTASQARSEGMILQMRSLVDAGVLDRSEAEAMISGSLTPPRMEKWPTPTVCGNYNRKGASATSGDGLATAVYQTPVARMWKDNGTNPSELERNSPTLAMQAGGSLNPTWVEWLMGWPLGWTDLKPLATDKSRCAQPQHGDC
jgi:hypothetical protein